MSMVLCYGCNALIDSDNDCECFVEKYNIVTVLCENCREAQS